jgi:uncharacterized low-complexity protein
VNSPGQRAPRTAVRRWRAPAVLALLVGLLGMHGLAPGGGVPQQTHTGQAHARQSHAVLRVHEPETSRAAACGHCGDGNCGGGHAQHADATCASGAVGGGPVLPPLVPDPVPAVVGEGAVRAHAVVEPDGARGPPSLAELQLLRI